MPAPVAQTTQAPKIGTAASAPAPLIPDVSVTGVRYNNNTDMNYWRNDVSAKEMRAELNRRYPDQVGNFDLKGRDYLLYMIETLIRDGQWVREDTARPSAAAPKAQARNKKRPADDDVQVSGVKFNNNTNIKWWKDNASMNELRAQITMRADRVPELKDRAKWAFLKKPELLAFVKKLIDEGKWVQ
jgi:Asp-tRNA(Asn)/Glu-tRNA(Gln) amidotransferase C subunit